jgi:hypothetical protein
MVCRWLGDVYLIMDKKRYVRGIIQIRNIYEVCIKWIKYLSVLK